MVRWHFSFFSTQQHQQHQHPTITIVVKYRRRPHVCIIVYLFIEATELMFALIVN